MNSAVKSVVAVWLVLMLSTAASTWWFAQPTFSAAPGTVAVMVIAAIKVGLVMSHFMELRGAPRPWQIAGVVWVIATAGTVMGIYLM
ncbi:cytochrome C oxidase subunit IV family protein [Nevskia ramosa]|uniref:cytochrome C oxidase subunit IV family protein n=1 Tax=Nevskia ramosa TaxID=64002 RepID=UPI002354F026